MANTKEIQKRMKSIRDTMKITSAMYMISSAKLRSAKQKLEQTEPYFYTLQSAIARFLRHMPDTTNRYFDQREQIPDNEKKRGYIVIHRRQRSCGCIQSQCHQNGTGTVFPGGKQ